MNGSDLSPLREFRRELAEPSEATLRRLETVLATATERTRERRPARQWAAIGVWAGAAVVMAVLTTLIVVNLKPVPPNAPPVAGSRPVPSSAPPTTPAVDYAAVINGLADAAARQPASKPVRAGELIRVDETFVQNGVGPLREAQWFDPNGAIKVKTKMAESNKPENTDPAMLTTWRNDFHARGANLWPNPTPQFLAGLSTDPEDLGAALDGCSVCDIYGQWPSPTTRKIEIMQNFFHAADLMAPPALRAGLLRLLAGSPDVSVAQVTIQGRRLWAVGADDAAHAERFELLVEPDTGRVVGSRQLAYFENQPGTFDPDSTAPPVIPTQGLPEPRLVEWRVWTAKTEKG